ncbi:MAG: hypothetical protein ACXVJ7_03695 [Acidimicrobiia bacterium]
MMHEYHAQLLVRERERWLRDATEVARLHREAGLGRSRRRWFRIRRRRAEEHRQPELAPQPGAYLPYPLYSAPR